MIDAHLPEIYVGSAFNAEPFDPTGVPVWADLSARYLGTGSATRGATQYELDQAQTGAADVTWYDQDEALNPANTSSPYSPYVVPYRPLLWLAMWPNSGTGNVLGGAGFDGSFESYTTTAQVLAWLAAMLDLNGGVATVSTLVGAGAWQGTKAASLAVSTSATTVGGVQFTLTLIPGRTYTVQAHVNQNVARTFQLAVGGQTVAVDPFTRVTASGWGTPPSVLGFGPAWATSGGTLANYFTAGGLATHSQSSVNVRMATLIAGTGTNAAVQDGDVWVTVTIPVVATGQAIQASLYARWLSANDSISCLISFSTNGQVTITAQKTVAGSVFSIGSNATVDSYVAGDSFRLHFQYRGADLWCKGWKVTSPIPEPTPWSVQTSDSSVSTPGKVGVTSILTTGNTNTLPVALAFSDFRATGSIVDTVNGVTAVSGSYQLLKQTFVATQPQTTIMLATRAVPPSAATILIDGIQIEPGSTANTFTTVGPTIRPVWTRGYIERFPIAWDGDSRGFLGIAQSPVVGPFFQLANGELHTEVGNSILAKGPRYWWRLNEPAGSSVFGDSSGYGGPSLRRVDQPIDGPADTFEAGADTKVVGDPSQSGVNIAGVNNPNNASIIQVGNGIGTDLTGLGVPIGVSAWGVTMSVWMSSSAIQSQLYDGQIAWLGGSPFVLGAGAYNPPSFHIQTSYILANQGPQAFFSTLGASVSTAQPASTNDYFDGLPHLYTATIAVANDNITITMYLDGAVYGTPGSASVSATFGSSTIPSQFGIAALAGQYVLGGNSSPVNMGVFGTYSEFAAFGRALSASEVLDLYNAGLGYPNENSGTRVQRYLTASGYVGSADVGAGMTTMGPSALTEGTAPLSAILDGPVDTEFGKFWESPTGVTFRGRQARYLAVSPSFVFGDRVDLGEYPYEGDIMYDDDATYVFNRAVITRTGGSILTATDPTGRSAMRYTGRTFTRTVGGNNDNEAQDMANWVVANYKDARPRLAALTFNAAATRGVTASSDGTLWPMLLPLEIGTRVTVKRRPKAANAGAGLTMSGDFFVEAITPGGINVETGTWDYVLLLSPAPVTAQPWILEDPTYGVLDSTTVLGF